MRLKIPAKRLFGGFVSLLYPRRCVMCDELRPFGCGKSVCADCLAEVPSYTAPPYEVFPSMYSSISRVYPAFVYRGYMRDAVIRLKFRGMKENAAVMAFLMKNAAHPPCFEENIRTADCFVPVPLHKSRLRERGFNQAELLAAGLSREYGIGMEKTLVRVRETAPMFGLARTERFENLDSAFAVKNPGTVRGKSLVLVDDIYTTGATMEECARTLKKCGAAKVFALAFACAVSSDPSEAP